MYHFTHFNITQFRGLRNLHLENLGRINLLVGMNNSGKTSVLEAISLYSRSLDILEWFNTATRRGLKPSLTPSMIEALKWLFPQSSNAAIIMTAQGSFAVREVQAIFEEVIATNDLLPSDLNSDLETATEPLRLPRAEIKVTQRRNKSTASNEFITTEQHLAFWKPIMITRPQQTWLEQALPVLTITPFSYQLGTAQVMQLSEAKKQGTFKLILTLLQQFDSKIEGLEILVSDTGNFPTLYLQHSDLGLSPIHVFGQGLQRVLAMALSLAQVPNGVLLIDEIEAGIHISWLSTVFSWLVTTCHQQHIQLFATTHSLEALDAVLSTVATDLEVPTTSEEIVAYRLPNPLTGTPLKRFGSNLLQRLRFERGLDMR